MAIDLATVSVYAGGLDEKAKARYDQKIAMIDNFDPMIGQLLSGAVAVVPPIDAVDLVSYLVLETSFVTSEQFKARKGLDAYNQFVSGWVKEVRSFRMSG